MENMEMKQLAALIHSLLLLSEYGTDEATRKKHTEFICDYCAAYDRLPEVGQIVQVDPVREFLRIENEDKRTEYLSTLLSFARCGMDYPPGKMVCLARLLIALDRWV